MILLAPAEKSLGQIIKLVYLHVALDGSGYLGFALSGGLGILYLFLPNRNRVIQDSRLIGWLALLAFTGGTILSLAAARLSWGSISLSEPLLVLSIRIILLALIVQTAVTLLPQTRWRGLIQVFPICYLVWAAPRVPRYMHPNDPIGASDSVAIRLAFLAFLILSLLTFSLIFLVYRQHPVFNEEQTPD